MNIPYTLEVLFKSVFSGPKIQEVYDAYFNKIPDNIQVFWKRDGDMITGIVTAGEHEFYTQGKNAENFIEMVNDATYTVFEIPIGYIDLLRKSGKSFSPNQEQLLALCNGDIKEATLYLKKTVSHRQTI